MGNTLDLFLLSLIIVILGIMLFLLTGFIKIKNGYIGLITRRENYVMIMEKGTKFFNPIFYKLALKVKLGENTQKIDINKQFYNICYEVIDIKQLYYSHKTIKGLLNQIDISNMEITKKELQNIGVRLISLSLLNRN